MDKPMKMDDFGGITVLGKLHLIGESSVKFDDSIDSIGFHGWKLVFSGESSTSGGSSWENRLSTVGFVICSWRFDWNIINMTGTPKSNGWCYYSHSHLQIIYVPIEFHWWRMGFLWDKNGVSPAKIGGGCHRWHPSGRLTWEKLPESRVENDEKSVSKPDPTMEWAKSLL